MHNFWQYNEVLVRDYFNYDNMSMVIDNVGTKEKPMKDRETFQNA